MHPNTLVFSRDIFQIPGKALVLILAFMLFPSLTLSQVTPPCRIKLGALLPLTGPASLIGDRSQQAATLALEQMPKELRERIQLIFEDTEMKPATGFKAAQKLLLDPEVVGLFGFGSETIGAISDFEERKQIPGIFVTPDRRPILEKRFLFRHWVTEVDLRDAILPELKNKNISRIAIIYSEIPAMTVFANDLINTAPNNGLEISFQTNVLPGETDFRTSVAAAINSKPQAIFFFFLAPQSSTFMKQLRSINKEIPVFSYINVENSQEIKAADGALEGVKYAGPKFQDDFVESFSKRFLEYPEFASGNMFDIINIYAEALKNGACSRTEIRDQISKTSNFKGALGTYGIQDKNDFRFPVKLKQIKAGKFEFVGN